MYTLSRWTIVDVLQIKGEWAQIRHRGETGSQKAQSGWVSVQYIQDVTPKGEAFVTASKLNVRKAPGGAVIATLPEGTVVAVLRTQNGWTQILAPTQNDRQEKQPGWVSAEYLHPIKGADTGDSKENGPRGCHCKMEVGSGAQVCVSVSPTKLDCRESYDTVSYRSCRVDLQYGLSTTYQGNTDLDISVACTVDVAYQIYGSDSWQSDSRSGMKSQKLTNKGKRSGEMAFDFAFDPKDEVINVKIESAACKIDDIQR